MDVRVGLQRKLSVEELILLNYGVEEDSWESPLECKEIQPVHPKGNQSWIFIGRTDAEAETPVLWPPMRRTDSFEKTLMLGKIAGGREGDDRGWDGWMVSRTWWTWVWVNSGSWWWTWRPGVLQSMELKRVGQDWLTELNWRGTNNNNYIFALFGIERGISKTKTVFLKNRFTWAFPHLITKPLWSLVIFKCLEPNLK